MRHWLGWAILIGASFVTTQIGVKLVMSAQERSRIDQLAPDVRRVYLDFLREAAARGLRLRTGRTQGSVKQTAANKAAGRSSVAVSWHDLEPPRAIDVQVRDPETGKILWGSDGDEKAVRLYREMSSLAEEFGFRQIGFWGDGSIRRLSSGAWDPYHLEYRGPYKTLAQAAKATGVKQA